MSEEAKVGLTNKAIAIIISGQKIIEERSLKKRKSRQKKVL